MGRDAPRIGDKAADGWIYGGISPDTGKPLFVAPADAGLMNWDDAMKTAEVIKKRGKKDARVPSPGELKQIFNNHAKIGGFNTSGDALAGGWYWSSSILHGEFVQVQAFDAAQNRAPHVNFRDHSLSPVRFVRD